MSFGPPQVVEGQPRVGLPFGLFSVLSLREASDPHWANGIEWETMTCSPASAILDADCDTNIDKFFNGNGEIGEAAGFTVYGSHKCGTPGGRVDLAADEFATAHLLAREEAQAETSVWAQMAAQATDLNAAGALPADEALALLEGWMGSVYGSLGAIHGSRQAVSLFDNAVRANGSRLLTRIGTPVVAGGGYPGTSPAGAAPAAGETWVFASPALFGYRGTIMGHQALDRNNNDMYALAERNYVVGFDPCGVGAVRMDVIG